MSDSLNLLITELTAFGLLTDEALRSVLESLPEQSRPQSAEALSDLLIGRDLLTPYQKQKLLAGSGKSLLMGNYLILDQLGKGGMGVVLKALHRRMDRLVALKVMAPGEVSSPDAVRRFHREVQAAARLTHPNIVIAYDADEADGSHFLVMEYVAGVDLHQHVQRHGPLSVESAVEVVIQAARGLEFSHQQGVIHRDIKPANLLLDAKGTVKILDMGLARLDGSLGNSADGSGLTSTGTIMGTVDFMSPEQAIDTKHADARSDIYSLGCTFYYLVSRETLYQGDTLMKRLLAHQSAPVPPLLEQLPEEAQDELTRSRFENINGIFLRMVAKSPDDRYQTMTEVIDEMEPFLQTREGASPLWKYRPSQDSGTPSFVLSTPSARKPGSHAPGSNLKTGGPQLPTVILPQQEPEETLIASGDAAPETIIQNGSPSSRSRKRMRSRNALAGGMVLLLLAGVGGWSVLRTSEQRQAGQVKTERNAALATLENRDASHTVLASPRSEPWIPTADQQVFFDHVAALSPEQQIEAVRKKVAEMNPGWDGKFTCLLGPGGITEVQLSPTLDRLEIWPVRAFPSLVHFKSSPPPLKPGESWEPRGVDDLSPLQGLPLTNVVVERSPLRSIAPLAGMPLTYLGISHTQVTDLSPIHTMPLEALGITGLPLKDLSALEGTQIRELFCGSLPISDLSQLSSLPLTHLSCSALRISDLSPLRGKPLVFLDLNRTLVEDLSPLKGMKLETLNCIETKVSDLTPLAGMPLKSMNLFKTPISDLAPLQGAPLETINLNSTGVTRLDPLKNSRLKELYCNATIIPRNYGILKQIPTLERINDKPAKEVLDAVPVPPKKTAAWMPTAEQQAFFTHVATLPPEQQVETVRRKMAEINPELREDEMTHRIEFGQVTVFAYHSDAMKIDIWPLGAFPHLRALDLLTATYTGLGEWKNRGVNDLSPLAGLPLTRLQIQGSLVRDLSPLQGMLLDSLKLDRNPVSDLSPLTQMPLTLLTFNGSSVSDLSPLRGMPLKTLNFAYTPVSDLSPLQGMLVQNLNMAGSKIRSLEPLLGMPLETFDCHSLTISDFSPLLGAPLKTLNCSVIPPDQFSIIQQLPLERIECPEQLLPEYRSFLKRMPTLKFINQKPAQQILDALPAEPKKTAWMPTSEQQAFFTHVATLPPEQQVETVRRKMAEINPGWDEQALTCVTDAKVVKEAIFPPTEENLDIWPIRAFSALSQFKNEIPRSLWGKSGKPKGGIDLSPLRGLPLKIVMVEHCHLESLESLSEMPLDYLSITETHVSDLSPIPSKLRGLSITGTKVTDLSQVQRMALTQLFCGNLPITDLSPISSLPLTALGIFSTRVSDLTPLRGMPLSTLDINHSLVEDLSPLRGMRLEKFYCSETKVSDLTPLAGMPLKELNLYHSKVTDLSPLRGAPLETVYLNSTGILQLDPLKDSRLKDLRCNDTIIPQNLAVLRQIPTLDRINGKPARDVLEGIKP